MREIRKTAFIINNLKNNGWITTVSFLMNGKKDINREYKPLITQEASTEGLTLTYAPNDESLFPINITLTLTNEERDVLPFFKSLGVNTFTFKRLSDTPAQEIFTQEKFTEHGLDYLDETGKFKLLAIIQEA